MKKSKRRELKYPGPHCIVRISETGTLNWPEECGLFRILWILTRKAVFVINMPYLRAQGRCDSRNDILSKRSEAAQEQEAASV